MDLTGDVHLRDRLVFPVNGKEIRFDDREVTGREALTAAGLVPASEYQLI